jgi:hypothetical protein
MNTEALFLFLILLFGIILFSFLAVSDNKEGFDLSNAYNSSVNTISDAANNTYNAVSNAASNTYNAMSNSASNTYNSVTENFDNYNHYNGTGSTNQLQNGMVFIDPSGDTVTVVTNSNGTQSLQLLQSGQTTPMVLTSTPPSSTTSAVPNTFYAPSPLQITATVITDSAGQTAIQFNVQGTYITFTQAGSNSNSNSTTSSQYYGSTGYQIEPSVSSQGYYGPYGGSAGAVSGPYGNTAYYAQGPYGNTVAGTTNNGTYPYTNQYYGPYGGSAGAVSGPYGNTAYYAQGPYGNTVAGTTNNGTYPYTNQYYGPYGGSAGSVTGPYGNTAYYAQGPYGNTVAGTTNNNTSTQYYSTLPPGIPGSQIPQGNEDLYILKSEIVPPVCPACPTSSACPREEPCPACPACARCPEPSFECKKVPNYNSINEDYLPVPVLNDFSQFGM